RIKAVGDIMLGSVTPKTIIPADSGNIFAASIGSYLSRADFLFGNLEGALITADMRTVKCSDTSRAAGRCYEFGMPVYNSPALVKMGFSVLNLDNNHSEDYGYNAYSFTQKRLLELNINPLPKKEIQFINYKNKIIAFIPFGYSGNSFDINNIEEANEIVKQTSGKADIIVVSFHGGAEGKNAQHVLKANEKFLGEDRGDVFNFAHSVIDAGADLVLGHGPHVLRGVEFYKNKLIAYSLGNFLTYGNVSISGVSGTSCILDVYIDENSGDFLRGKIIPVIQTPPGIPEYDKNNNGIKIIAGLTSVDFPATRLFFLDSGFIVPNISLLPDYFSFEIRSIPITPPKDKITQIVIPDGLKPEIKIEK
ncbi:MAG: CapA family protein, partial [Ignavibacteriaceae bacterium]|nr:CapA family protein [Ignavibacteriaceae bacterium]